MSNVTIGQVVSVTGLAVATGGDGSIKMLAPGMEIKANDIVSTTAGTTLIIQRPDGIEFSLGEGQSYQFNTELLPTELAQQELPNVLPIQEMIKLGFDPQLFIDPALLAQTTPEVFDNAGYGIYQLYDLVGLRGDIFAGHDTGPFSRSFTLHFEQELRFQEELPEQHHFITKVVHHAPEITPPSNGIPSIISVGDITHDETVGIDLDANDSNDPLPLALQGFGQPLGYAHSVANLLNFDVGPDGLANVVLVGANGQSLSGVDSGLTDLHNTPILLFTDQNNDNTILGFANGVLIFAISVDESDKSLWLVQYQPIFNPVFTDSDDQVGVENLIFLQIEDGNGDIVTSASPINAFFQDDGPTLNVEAPAISANLEEDDMAFVDGDNSQGNNEDGSTNNDEATGSGANSVITLFNSGVDTPLTFSLSTTTSGLPTLFSQGEALVYNVAGNILTATAHGNTIFTFTVDSTTGNWAFDLQDQLDHVNDGNNNENLDLVSLNGSVASIDLSSIIVATDADGDKAPALGTGKFTIAVQDDTLVTTDSTSFGTVDEDGVLEGAANNGPGDGIAGGTGDVAGQATVATGNVSALFQSGADESLTYGFAANTVTTLQALGLTSQGVPLTYTVLTDTVTASAPAGNVIFTFQLIPVNGNWTFTLVDQLDHATGGNENDLLINLGAIVQATDFDGDSVVAPATALVITVDDDTLITTSAQSLGTVDEDGVLEGAANNGPGDGIAGGTGDVAGQATVATGNVSALFQSGADESLTYGFAANTVTTLQALGLTSQGVPLTYTVLTDTVTASAPAGNVIFTFQLIPANGNWTFTLVDQLDHATGGNENDLLINLGAIVQATDFDGDSVVAPATALVITVDDDTLITTSAQSLGTVDEDGVLEGAANNGPGDGIAGGTGDVAGQATVATGNVSALFQSGADESLTYGFAANTVTTLQALGLTSQGVPLTYTVLTDTVTASAPAGNVIFTFQLIPANGNWTFTLVDQLDHATGGNENDLLINLGAIVQATDFDGDSVVAPATALVITVDDDTLITTSAQSLGTVDEDGVLEGAANNGPGDGIAGGTGDVAGQATVATGNVSALFQSGADESLTYGFAANTVTTLQALGLTSQGVPLTYTVLTDTVTASAPAGNVIFTFQLIPANGNWTFTLVDQLDHATGGNENDLLINLGAIVQATDFDGDSVVAPATALVITVDDDTLITTSAQSLGTVDEDGVLEGAANNGPGDGIAGGTGDVAGQATVATGNVSALFQSGADESLTYGFAANTVTTLQALGLTSQGVPLTYTVLTDTVTASAPAGNVIFTFQLIPANGNWTFTLVDQLDHATGGNENDLLINLGAIVQATDFDGDSVVAPATALVITVDDDTLITTSAQSLGTVDEDGVLEGAANNGPGDGIAGGTGDVAGQATVATGNVSALFQSGADESLTYGFAANTVTTLQALGLTSQGVPLTYTVLTDTVTASAPAGNVIFTFQLIPANGNWTFTLVDQLDHATGGNENDLLINLGAIVQATDFDGDSVVAPATALVITVDDDTLITTSAQSLGTVDEDGVLEGAANNGPGDGIAGGTGDVAGQATVATGNVSALFQSGADESLTYGFAANTVTTLQALGLTSQGVPLTYTVLTDTVTASAPAGNVIFTFQLIPANGNWTFTLVDQLDHATGGNENDLLINLGAIVQATDFDGDSVVAPATALVITVDDDTLITTSAQSLGTVDEDGVLEGAANNGPGDGIAGGTGDVAGQATVATGNVSALFQSGADESLTYGFAANTVTTLQALGLTSQGVPLTYTVLTDTVTASAPAGNVIFTFQLIPVNGNWTFTLVDQLDHATGGNENDLLINLGAIVQATDFDGDSVVAPATALVITVDDDTLITTSAQSLGTVDEDGVLEGAANNGPGDGIAGGTGDVAGQATVATGNVSALFQSGADESLTYGFAANTVTTLQALGLTSQGVPLTYTVLTDTVTASAPAGNVIFTFQLIPVNGNWTFTLVDQLDHATGGNENDLLINLGAIVQATDFDGDSVVAPATALVITVDDDTLITTSAQSLGTVDEDGVLEGAANNGPGDGIAGGTGDVAGQATVATGNVSALFQSGADESLTYGFAANTVTTLQALGLTSQGVPLTYTVLTDTVTASAPAGNVIFTFQLIPVNGNWTFTLVDQLDHATGGNENDLLINLGAIVQATDFDGDSVVAPATALVITVDDDTLIATNFQKTITEGQTNTNLMLILDTSGSMGEASGLPNLTRMEVQKAAVNDLLDLYDIIGDVSVGIVTFNNSASAFNPPGAPVFWTMNLTDAKTFINGMTPGVSPQNLTNYDEGLADAINAFPNSGTIAGAQNVTYFLSDGLPTTSSTTNTAFGTFAAPNGIQPGEEASWTNFVNTNDINAFALGLFNASTPAEQVAAKAQLDPIAYNGLGAGTNTDSFVITDLSLLSATLTSTITTTSGNVITDMAVNYGADDPGFIKTIGYMGDSYTYNPGLNTVTPGANSDSTAIYNPGTFELTITTDTQGIFKINFANNNYNYTAPSNLLANLTAIFAIGFVDADGDFFTSDLTFNVNNTDLGPIASDDRVITNMSGGGAAIIIPEYALLNNDHDPEGNNITIPGAATNLNDASSVPHTVGVSFTFNDNDSDGGNFTYTVNSGNPILTETALVTVNRTQAGDSNLDGTGFADILIGRDAGSNNDTIFGYAGNDVLLGQGGVDNLNGGDGNDLLVGGTGNDVLNGDNGNDVLRGGAGDDTINGNAGTDMIDFSDATGFINFTLPGSGNGSFSASGVGTDTFTGIEGVVGSGSNDILVGNSSANLIRGSIGDDAMTGNNGNDTFILKFADVDVGGADTDTITDFSNSPGNEDILDIGSMLNGADPHTNLTFTYDGTDTTLTVDANNGGTSVDHIIVFENTDMYALYGAPINNSSALIDQATAEGALQTTVPQA